MHETVRRSASELPQQWVGLIGNPVAHSYSPRFQQAAFDALGIPARYELWPTGASELPSRIASLLAPQCLGANVTIPYKELVIPLLNSIDPFAARIGAVNTIVHTGGDSLSGYNTDAPGLLNALAEHDIGCQRQQGISLNDYTAVLLGAGGAARSAAFALISARISRLIFVNRTLDRAQQLAADLQEAQDASAQETAIHLVSLDDPHALVPLIAGPLPMILINATPLGMQSSKATADASPLPLHMLEKFTLATFVFDMVYNPRQTRLLSEARALGLRGSNGLSMLLHQGALSFALWTGQPAPLEIMRAACAAERRGNHEIRQLFFSGISRDTSGNHAG